MKNETEFAICNYNQPAVGKRRRIYWTAAGKTTEFFISTGKSLAKQRNSFQYWKRIWSRVGEKVQLILAVIITLILSFINLIPYMPPQNILPTDGVVFRAEIVGIIERIAGERSSVVWTLQLLYSS